MKTFVISVDQAINTTILAKATQGNEVAPELIDVWERRIFEWELTSTKENKDMMEAHEDALSYHRGGKTFWFDGGENGDVIQRRFLGYGDGVRTDFMIPYRWVYAPSLVMSVNGVIVGTWTLTESTGLVRFDTAPALDAQVHAERFKCRFKGFFIVDNNKLYEVTNQFKSFESKAIRIREDPR